MTPRGWLLLGFGFATWAIGRLVGVGELLQVAIGAGTLCAGALVWTRVGRQSLEASRTLSRPWVHRGEPVELTITVRNPNPVPSPQMLISQTFPKPQQDLTGLVAGIRPRSEREITYSFTPPRRGRYRLDALRLTFTDPFGAARISKEINDETIYVVFPAVEPLPSLLEAVSTRPGSRTRRAPALHGEDFFGIREYEIGDDPRKVHWPSSARTGTLMVREDEAGGRQLVNVFLDDRSSSYKTSEAFEYNVEAAASIVSLYAKEGFAIRLGRASGPGIPIGRGSGHYRKLLEELAIVAPGKSRPDVFGVLARGRREGTLVILSGGISGEEAQTIARTVRGHNDVILILAPERKVKPPEAAMLVGAGVRLITPAPGESLRAAWTAAMLHIA
jgi:uncharacterized protein (DUF58 family)